MRYGQTIASREPRFLKLQIRLRKKAWKLCWKQPLSPVDWTRYLEISWKPASKMFYRSSRVFINNSMAEGVFPGDFKQAIVKPILKKPSLDKECLKNYWPVSNILHVSKFIKKDVAKRIEEHLSSNTLHDNLQSAYRVAHFTETALLWFHYDIVASLDKECYAVLLVCSMSLTTIYVSIDYGLAVSALQLLHSYLSDRPQRVSIGLTLLTSRSLKIGVSIGFGTRPRNYCMYAKPFGNICHRNNMNYADDTQIYIMIEPRDNWNKISIRLTACLDDIQNWLSANLLKLSLEKTELMILAPIPDQSKHWRFQLFIWKQHHPHYPIC